MFRVGPIGSKGYNNDKSWDEKGRTKISNIYVSFDDSDIKSIQFSYFQNGAQVMSKQYGSKGKYFKLIRLNHDEYVTGLSGIDLTGGITSCGITSLTFHTNQKKHGPICRRYDDSSGHLKDYKREIDVGICDPREFGGFFGSFSNTGGSLKSIGMYVCPMTRSYDAVLGTLDQSSDPIARFGYQSPKTVDGFPVEPLFRYKPKLKDRIFSKLKIFFRNLFLD